MTTATLRFATHIDIPFIMATERGPGFEPLVGRFEEDAHRTYLIDTNWLYFIGLDGAKIPQGFAILQDVEKNDGSQFLRRIAVVNPGQGFGKPFLSAVIDFVFAATDAQRFWLSVRNGNARARHVYSSLGFVAEGPESPQDPDSTIMAVTRAAWRAR